MSKFARPPPSKAAESASSRLRRRSVDIMLRWEERANKEVLGAMRLESLALRDSLPDLLTLIAQALCTATSRNEARAKWEQEEGNRVGKNHGRDRASSEEYTISQMIFEYHILRQTICDVMEEEEVLSPVDREVIVGAIEQAVNVAATQFSDTVNEAQERLASTLTHDLRSPLTVVSLAAQKILRQPDDADGCVRAAERIERSIDRLEQMVQGLLDVSRIKCGKTLFMRLEKLQAEELAGQLAEDFALLYGQRVAVVSRLAGEVRWDRAEICRLIENLTSNAVKYGTKGTQIAVSLLNEGDEVVLRVHNEGPVIPADQHEQLFRQFYRGVSVHQHKGWGIGLTVVKGIVDAHHGRIRIESTQGTGTSFVVHLPRDARKEKAASADAES